MRFEAKHSYFKSLAQSMGNFINLPYTLSMRHQQYLSYLNASKDLWHKTIEVGKGIQVKFELSNLVSIKLLRFKLFLLQR